MTSPSCPRCGIEVGATWRWCLACGYDPDGTQQRIRDDHVAAHLRKGAWTPVVVVLIGMFIGAAILWRTAPDDGIGPQASPTTSEIVRWSAYSPPDGSFRGQFPAEPTPDRTSSPVDGRPVDTYLTLVNSHLFGVTITDTGQEQLDAGVTDEVAEKTLLGFITDATRVSGGRVGATEATTVSSAPALDYEVTGVPLGTTRGRLVLVGRQVYNVMISGPEPTDGDVDRFVGSFALS